MIRRVAFSKAIIAGACGALAWEAAMRSLILMGVPLFDLVRTLGTMMLGRAPAWHWWPVGITMHISVGAIWAIFYAYFFWSTFDWPPTAQGMMFALLPAILAGAVMVPQMSLMHPLVLRGEMLQASAFASNLGWGGPFGIVLGHLIYGAVMGSLYTKPVGSKVRRQVIRHG